MIITKLIRLPLTLALFAIGGLLAHGQDQERQPQDGRVAVAYLNATSGSRVTGTVTFFETEAGVLIAAEVQGLRPGYHGFTIHENGHCAPSGKDKQVGGAHFNPEGKRHGPPGASYSHLGDLGNLQADDAGTAYFSELDPDLSFEGGRSILGRAIVVHEGVDDMLTQPHGDSGPAAACGVIEMRDERQTGQPAPGGVR